MAESKTPSAEASKSPGVDPEKVKGRIALLIQNGTNPLIAEKIAEDAEAAQVQRDKAYAALQETKEAAQAASEAPSAKKKGGN